MFYFKAKPLITDQFLVKNVFPFSVKNGSQDHLNAE